MAGWCRDADLRRRRAPAVYKSARTGPVPHFATVLFNFEQLVRSRRDNYPNVDSYAQCVFYLAFSDKRAAQMHTIVLATQKGGSGKSTLAIGLAAAAIENGQRVGVIEADPQGTILSWSRRRTNPDPRIERASSGKAIEHAVLELEQAGFTVAIVDTSATENTLSEGGISAADLCLIPARPSLADIEAALPTVSIVRRLDKRFAFILNQTPTHCNRVTRAASTLHAAGVLALPYIGHRNDHQDAFGAGLGVTEYDSDGKAAQEVRGLWQWVWKSLTSEPPIKGTVDREGDCQPVLSRVGG